MRHDRLRIQRRSCGVVMETVNRDRLSSKKTRRIIDLETKMKVIKHFEGGKSVSVIARLLDMPQSTIATILRNREKVTEAVKGSASLKVTRLTKMREGPISDMENLLMSWIEEEARNGNPPNTAVIKSKAKNLFDVLKEKAGPDCDVEFSASSGWFMRFKNRYSVDSFVDSISADVKTIGEFAESLDKVISEGGYAPEQIFNMDETTLFWKCMPQGSLNNEKLKPEASKDRITILLGGNAAGFKLKPFVIWHSDSIENLKKIDRPPVHCRSHKKPSMTQEFFQDAFRNCYKDEIERYCADNNIPFKILLILEETPVHSLTLEDVLEVLYLPPNTKSLTQPLDQGVFAAFKACYLRQTLAEAAVATGEAKKTLAQFLKEYDAPRCMKNLAQAWDNVPRQCMTGVWKKILTRFPVESWSSEEEINKINKSAIEMADSLYLNDEDVEEVLKVVPEELTNVELLEGEHQVPEKKFTEKSLAEFFRDLDKLLKKAEDMDPNSERFSIIKRNANAVFAEYREIYEEKLGQRRSRTRKKAASSSCRCASALGQDSPEPEPGI